MRFDSYHPAINAIYFVAVILCSIMFHHPIYLALSFCCAACYLTKLRGVKGLTFSLALLPFAALFALWYGFYHHFGVTVLRQNFIGNDITAKAHGNDVGIVNVDGRKRARLYGFNPRAQNVPVHSAVTCENFSF